MDPRRAHPAGTLSLALMAFGCRGQAPTPHANVTTESTDAGRVAMQAPDAQPATRLTAPAPSPVHARTALVLRAPTCAEGTVCPPHVVEIALSDLGLCARMSDGRVRCTRTGATDTPADLAARRAVAGLRDVTRLSFTGSRAGALLADGRAVWWGSAHNPAFSRVTDPSYQATPVPAPVAGRVEALVVGPSHSCAVIEGGGAQCWGLNTYWALGNGVPVAPGSTRPRLPPRENERRGVAVRGLVDAVQIAVGDDHTCARTRRGTVACWGSNPEGNLGFATEGGVDAMVPAPVEVPGISGAVEIAAGGRETCARFADGHVDCWGGDGPRGTVRTPTAVRNLTDAVQLAFGATVRCARLADGTVRCWGHAPADPGGASDGDASPLEGIRDAVQLVTSGFLHCALRADTSVTCGSRDRSTGHFAAREMRFDE